MGYDYLSEAESLRETFTGYIKQHKGELPHGAVEEQLREIILDIKMLLYSYDPDMPLTAISRDFPRAAMCLMPEAFGRTEKNTADVIVSTLDRFIKLLHRRQDD